MQRAKWYNIHSWVGLKLSILLCFVLVTGTLAVLSHEIDWLTNPAMRIYSTESQSVDWDLVYSEAKKHFPESTLSSLADPKDPWFAVEAIYIDADKERFRGYFHPQTGEFQGTGRWFNWQRFFRMTHRHLMMPLNIGITIVCITGLLLLMSLISGIALYKDVWKNWLRWPRRHNPKVFWGDVHRLAASWSLWLIVVICITGIWYLVEQWGGRAQYPANGRAAHEQLLMPSASEFQQMQWTLKTQMPTLTIATIRFPTPRNNAVLFEGQAGDLLVRDRANNMVFDPLTAEVLSSRIGSELSWHVRISEAADPLHFGTFGGFTTKVIYFIFGSIMSALAIIGTYLYGLRVTRQPRNQPKVSIWPNVSAGMGYWKWLSVSLISICGLITIKLFV